MMSGYFKIVLTVLLFLLFSVPESHAQTDKAEQHRLVVMRMIGHEILLNSNDKTSRILPIEKEESRYKIQFENEFSFQPQVVGGIIDSLILKTKIGTKYIVEVENCKTKKVVYSYEITNIDSLDLVPCGSRVQPKGCYTAYVTLFDTTNQIDKARIDAIVNRKSNDKQTGKSSVVLSVTSVLLTFISALYYMKKKKTSKVNPDVIQIGNTIYDKRAMVLKFKNDKTELSSKEADLLLLLFASENVTLEREFILKEIWNDEGDYVGRTLDVFVSKLRKKLEADLSIRIINVRGIGYKLVVQVQN